MSDISLLRELYNTERRLENRNYAKGHSFEEWCDNRRRTARDDDRWAGCSRCVPIEGYPNVLTHKTR